MTITDQLQKMWSDFLGFLSTLVIPDWNGLIALLPLLILVGVVGPILTLLVLGWLGYGITKPRARVTYVEGPRTAPLDALGEPVFPAGEPYCPADGLIHASDRVRCERDGSLLLVRCPKCEVVREAGVRACGNCGLVLQVEPRALVIATDRPPPGGAAVA